MARSETDVVVVGGGIVGLATARALLVDDPGLSVAVIEKERSPALHQSGRNSGVLHSGIYYRPGSLKSRLVASGRREMLEFCQTHDIPLDLCGKVIVAVSDGEVAGLEALGERAATQGIAAERLGPSGLRDHEPHAAGVAALFVPGTGVVDFGAVAGALADDVAGRGGRVVLETAVLSLDQSGDGVTVATDAEPFRARAVVNCAGLHADRLAPATGVRIVPFRGEYRTVGNDGLVRHLIYPVPDPRFPFLGVHLTRSIHGSLHAGPNAVLALAREGYRWSTVDVGEIAALLRAPGVWRMARRYWRTGLAEVWRSLSERAFVRAVQRLVPGVVAADLTPAPAGVRAQAVGPDGALLDDFSIVEDGRCVHVLNAPSPAATASLAIGREIAARAVRRLG